MFMTLSHMLVCYLISFVYLCFNRVFLREEADVPPSPLPDPQLLDITKNFLTMLFLFISICSDPVGPGGVGPVVVGVVVAHHATLTKVYNR